MCKICLEPIIVPERIKMNSMNCIVMLKRHELIFRTRYLEKQSYREVTATSPRQNYTTNNACSRLKHSISGNIQSHQFLRNFYKCSVALVVTKSMHKYKIWKLQ